jgi:hypothetical protein
MKRSFFKGTRSLVVSACVLAWLATCASEANAQEAPRPDRDFGLGIIIGDPTGLSAKYFLAPDQALDFALGLGFIGREHVAMHLDYLFHFDLKRWPSAALDLYLGIGPKLGFHEHRDDDLHVRIGARAPFGFAMAFINVPFDVFVELAAGLWLVDKVDVDLDAAIGGRYWF